MLLLVPLPMVWIGPHGHGGAGGGSRFKGLFLKDVASGCQTMILVPGQMSDELLLGVMMVVNKNGMVLNLCLFN